LNHSWSKLPSSRWALEISGACRRFTMRKVSGGFVTLLILVSACSKGQPGATPPNQPSNQPSSQLALEAPTASSAPDVQGDPLREAGGELILGSEDSDFVVGANETTPPNSVVVSEPPTTAPVLRHCPAKARQISKSKSPRYVRMTVDSRELKAVIDDDSVTKHRRMSLEIDGLRGEIIHVKGEWFAKSEGGPWEKDPEGYVLPGSTEIPLQLYSFVDLSEYEGQIMCHYRYTMEHDPRTSAPGHSTADVYFDDRWFPTYTSIRAELKSGKVNDTTIVQQEIEPFVVTRPI
jgi:hypothetical protein